MEDGCGRNRPAQKGRGGTRGSRAAGVRAIARRAHHRRPRSRRLLAAAPSEWADWVRVPSGSREKSHAEAALISAAPAEFALFLLAQAAPDEWNDAKTWRESALEGSAPVEFWEALVATTAPRQWAQWRVARIGSIEQLAAETALIRATPAEFSRFWLVRKAPREFSAFRRAANAENDLVLWHGLAESVKWGVRSDIESQAGTDPDSASRMGRVPTGRGCSRAVGCLANSTRSFASKATLALIRGAPREWAERPLPPTSTPSGSPLRSSESRVSAMTHWPRPKPEPRPLSSGRHQSSSVTSSWRNTFRRNGHAGVYRREFRRETILAEKALGHANAAPQNWAAAELAVNDPEQWARFDAAPLGLEKALAAAALIRSAPVAAWRAIGAELYFARAHLAEEAPERRARHYYEPEGRNAKRALIRARPPTWAESERQSTRGVGSVASRLVRRRKGTSEGRAHR